MCLKYVCDMLRECRAPSIRVIRAETRLTVYCAPYISSWWKSNKRIVRFMTRIEGAFASKEELYQSYAILAESRLAIFGRSNDFRLILEEFYDMIAAISVEIMI